MKLSFAVAGKGGTGKTTLAALMVRALKQANGGPILAVDADPTSNLAEALGVDPGRPLAEIRERGSSEEGSPAGGVGRARAIDDELQRAITEAEGFDLITMGRGEGPRCYCYVNTLLRKSLAELWGQYKTVVLDNEAGMEHLSRRTTNNVDFLIVVMNLTEPSFRAAKRILELSSELPVTISNRALLVNRVGPCEARDDIERRIAELNVTRLTDVPQDDTVERIGASGGSAFDVPQDSPAMLAVNNIVGQMQAALSITESQ